MVCLWLRHRMGELAFDCWSDWQVQKLSQVPFQ